MKKFTVRLRSQTLLILFAGAIAVCILLFLSIQKPLSLAAYAKNILSACEKSAHRPSCYEKEIPKLMRVLRMEDAFTVTSLVQDADRSFVYCHVVAHKLSYLESEKHPEKWKEVLSRCPVAMCNYGCLHGSLMQRFQKDVLSDSEIKTVLPDLQNVCEKRVGFAPTEIERSMCYHAMGHLSMFLTGGKIPKALDVCRTVSVKPDGANFLPTCTEGVFMTVFQGIDPEDIALVADIKPEKENVHAFCNAYDGLDRNSCFRESYPLFSSELEHPSGAVAFCSYATDEATQENCYGAVINTLVTNWFSGTDGHTLLEDYCEKLPLNRQGLCFSLAAMRLVQIDALRYIQAAKSICEQSHAFGGEEKCFADVAVFGKRSFRAGSPELREYCASLPEAWKNRCML